MEIISTKDRTRMGINALRVQDLAETVFAVSSFRWSSIFVVIDYSSASTCASDWWRNQQWRQPAPAAPVAVQPQSPPVPQATSPPLPQNIPFQPAPVVPVQPPVVPQKPKKPVNLFQTIVPLAKEKPELIRTEIISTGILYM